MTCLAFQNSPVSGVEMPEVNIPWKAACDSHDSGQSCARCEWQERWISAQSVHRAGNCDWLNLVRAPRATPLQHGTEIASKSQISARGWKGQLSLGQEGDRERERESKGGRGITARHKVSGVSSKLIHKDWRSRASRRELGAVSFLWVQIGDVFVIELGSKFSYCVFH